MCGFDSRGRRVTANTLPSSRIRTGPALAATASIGALAAVQARINGQLGVRLDDGLAAASISFGSGLLILAVLSAALPEGRRGVRTLVDGVRGRRIPRWMLLPGVAGALTVATQGLAVGIIGVALFSVGFVAGQVVFGLALDRIGFGPGGIVRVTPPRLIGGLLALVAVGIALTAGGSGAVSWGLLVLPFLSGTVVLLVPTLAHAVVVGGPDAPPGDWWLYAGGAIGVIYIVVAANLVARTGVLLLALGSVAGQLAMSVVLDVGWPTPASPGLAHELTMVAAALASVVVAAVPWGGRAARSADR